MRRSLRQTTFSFGLLAALVVAVASACGTPSSGGLGNTGGSSSGASDDDGGGASSGCSSGFACGPSSGGGSGSGGIFMSDGSVPTPPMMTSSVVTIDSCPGTLAASMVTALESASTSAGSGMKMLYPYDQTVFPGGIPAPILQWSQTGTPDGVYVHLSSTLFDYKDCFAGGSPTNFTLATTPWLTAWAQSKGLSDPLTVEIATSTGGTIASVTTHWIFAKGSLAGDVYYNTYNSKLVPGQTASNGAVMQIKNGATAPDAFLYTSTANGGCPPLTTCSTPFGPCTSCHSLSANGSYLVAQEHQYPSSTALYGKGSMSFDLLTTTALNPTMPLANSTTVDWGFSAMYPDGTFLLTAGEPENTSSNPVFPGVAGNNPGMVGPSASVFFNTTTGAMTAPSGLDTPYAMMPSFSVDGSYLVYNNNPGMADAGSAAGHSLATATFTKSSMSFSNVKPLYSNSTLYPGWPAFTPDDKDVVFSLGNGDNFATEVPPTETPLYSAYLYIVDVATGTAHRLDEASGYNSAGTEYLPFPGRDEGYDFYPTINPVPSGGYFWVYFTSRRAYGNVYPGNPTSASNPGGTEADVGTKAIWVAAIDIAPAPGTDPSHPAFYLPGQEVGSGNIRAFPVLQPCSGNGATCESGLDCCGGSCVSGKCGVPTGCANDSDRCSSTIPCCDHSEMCIGSICSTPSAQ
jgi:hypothetical protein